jgi:hypothetical protein
MAVDFQDARGAMLKTCRHLYDVFFSRWRYLVFPFIPFPMAFSNTARWYGAMAKI